MGDSERIRIVVLGGTGVGKTAILKRFLFNTYPEKHRPTIDDLFTNQYDIGPTTLKVDFLDTSGEMEFVVMRKLSITQAQAFLIVYGIDNKESFEQVKCCFEEIREHRSDFQEVPIIFAGNKCDLPTIKKDVEFDEVSDWIHDQLPKIRGKAMECSAKEGKNIREIFKSFLQLSQMSGPPTANAEEPPFVGGALRRRSSAYAATTKGGRPQFPATPPTTACSSPKIGLGMFRGVSTPTGASSSQFDFEGGGLNRSKPRSRSLIRRSSKKTKPQMRDPSGGSGVQGECVIS